MVTKLLAVAAFAALVLGAASAEAALYKPEVPGATTDEAATPVHYRYAYREFWRGNCLYRTVYITDGIHWRYRWRRKCYGRYTE